MIAVDDELVGEEALRISVTDEASAKVVKDRSLSEGMWSMSGRGSCFGPLPSLSTGAMLLPTEEAIPARSLASTAHGIAFGL